MKDGKPILVTFGLGGHTIYYAEVRNKFGSSSCKLQGYDSPDEFPSRMESSKVSELDGVPVFDGCGAYEEKPGLAIKSPLVSQSGKISRFKDIPGVSDSMVLDAFKHGTATQRGLAAMGKAAISLDFSGLDSLPVPIWLEWWRANDSTGKARYGVFQDGRIEWTQ